MSVRCLRIENRRFVAGVEINANWIVVRAAPIVRYMLGWSAREVIGYCNHKKWGHEWIE